MIGDDTANPERGQQFHFFLKAPKRGPKKELFSG
jgi:hypothetical protein